MHNFTEQEYETAISDCCQLRTYMEHATQLMLCWGLCSAIKYKEQMKCTLCEYATRGKTKKEIKELNKKIEELYK